MIFTFKRGINVIYHKQDIFWCPNFDSFKLSLHLTWGARRPLAPGIRGWGRDGGNSLRRIERLGETGLENGQFSNPGRRYPEMISACTH